MASSDASPCQGYRYTDCKRLYHDGKHLQAPSDWTLAILKIKADKKFLVFVSNDSLPLKTAAPGHMRIGLEIQCVQCGYRSKKLTGPKGVMAHLDSEGESLKARPGKHVALKEYLELDGTEWKVKTLDWITCQTMMTVGDLCINRKARECISLLPDTKCVVSIGDRSCNALELRLAVVNSEVIPHSHHYQKDNIICANAWQCLGCEIRFDKFALLAQHLGVKQTKLRLEKHVIYKVSIDGSLSEIQWDKDYNTENMDTCETGDTEDMETSEIGNVADVDIFVISDDESKPSPEAGASTDKDSALCNGIQLSKLPATLRLEENLQLVTLTDNEDPTVAAISRSVLPDHDSKGKKSSFKSKCLQCNEVFVKFTNLVNNHLRLTTSTRARIQLFLKDVVYLDGETYKRTPIAWTDKSQADYSVDHLETSEIGKAEDMDICLISDDDSKPFPEEGASGDEYSVLCNGIQLSKLPTTLSVEENLQLVTLTDNEDPTVVAISRSVLTDHDFKGKRGSFKGKCLRCNEVFGKFTNLVNNHLRLTTSNKARTQLLVKEIVYLDGKSYKTSPISWTKKSQVIKDPTPEQTRLGPYVVIFSSTASCDFDVSDFDCVMYWPADIIPEVTVDHESMLVYLARLSDALNNEDTRQVYRLIFCLKDAEVEEYRNAWETLCRSVALEKQLEESISENAKNMGTCVNIHKSPDGLSLMVIFDDILDPTKSIQKELDTLKILSVVNEKTLIIQEDQEERELERAVLLQEDIKPGSISREDKYEISLGSAALVEQPVSKRCYFLSQMLMGEILKDRLVTIYKHHHSIDVAKQFDNVKFLIFTARFNMLEQQTAIRLSNPGSGCLPKSDLQDRHHALKIAQKSVHKYSWNDVDKKKHAALIEEIEDEANKRTLFLIIGDEAHWGITGGIAGQEKGNNKWINTWSKYRNVFVLLVTATPYNLLTADSRLPVLKCAQTILSGDTHGEGDMVVLTKNSTSKFAEEAGTKSNVTGKIGHIRELHVAAWSEGELQRFATGIQTKLKVARKVLDIKEIDTFMWLSVCDNTIEVTDDAELATEFTLQGKYGIVTIMTDDKMVLTLQGRRENQLELRELKDCTRGEPFEVVTQFGVDVIGFRTVNRVVFSVLHYDSKVDRLDLKEVSEASLQDTRGMACDCMFYMHEPRLLHRSNNSAHYLSLNFYFNSMRNSDPYERYIREDCTFQCSVKAMKTEFRKSSPRIKQYCTIENKCCRCKELKGGKKPDSFCFGEDDLLAAEYAYYILIIKLIRESTIDTGADILKLVGDYSNGRKHMINQYREELQRSRGHQHISIDMFDFVIDMLGSRVKARFYDDLDSLKKEGSLQDLAVVESLLISWVACLFHLSGDQIKHLCAQLSNKLKESNMLTIFTDLLNGEFQRHKAYHIKANETARIVDDLVIEDINTVKPMKGKMTIFRAKSAHRGNRFYQSVCLARHVSHLRKELDGPKKLANKLQTSQEQIADSNLKISSGMLYSFEILRDFANFNLKTEVKKTEEPLFRIHRKLQPSLCQHRDENDTPCSCAEYFPLESSCSLVCQSCQHKHRLIQQYEDIQDLPCLLILVDKGRMGDTYPASFACMDLRMTSENDAPFLSSVVQELGRLCRYRCPSLDNTIPYALVGAELHKLLRKSLCITSCFFNYSGNKKPDKYMDKRNRRGGSSSGSINFRWDAHTASKKKKVPTATLR